MNSKSPLKIVQVIKNLIEIEKESLESTIIK